VGQQRWIIGGDFNIIISLDEKRGGVRILDKDSENFQNLIEDLHLIDIEAQNGFHMDQQVLWYPSGSLSVGSLPDLRIPHVGRTCARGKHSPQIRIRPLANSILD
jgi:hypothetical protein